ncbi:hypothetical protein D3C81_2093060 [compost metagenome]
MNIRAVARLMRKPMPATIMMTPEATGAGSARRRTASKAMAPQAKISRSALPSAASTVALP